ncbi:MAG: hypothetical protein JWP02_103, partial [Acidimicrobiales bacterium]|nr:hypothetical protein [Acidimicrobiales bacterium]
MSRVAANPGQARAISRWIWVPILAPLAVFWRSVAGFHLLAPGDGYEHYLPLHILAARAWRAGHLPAWNPFGFSGYPLMATNQAAVFYPPNALFIVAGPAIANNLTVVFSFAIAGAGAFLLGRRLCGDDVGALVAGLGFAFCGFMFAHIGHQSMIASISWLPWTLLGFDLVRQRITPLRLSLASGALALALIAGHSQMFALVGLALGIYAGALAVLEWRETRGRPLLVAAVVGVVACGLAAVQLVPTLSILRETDRSKLSYADATSFSYMPSDVPLIAFPYLNGAPYPTNPFSSPYRGHWNLTELSGYPGMAVLALAGAGLGALRRDRRSVALVAVGATTLLMAVGATTPIGRVVYHVPLFGQFRAWARYVVVTDLVLALLAAYGVAALRSESAEIRRAAVRRAGIVAALVVGAAASLPFIHRLQPSMAGGSARVFALAVPALAAVAGAAGALLVSRGRRLGAVAAVGLVAVVALDGIFTFGWFYEWRTHEHPVSGMKSDFSASEPALWGRVTDAAGGIDRWVYASSDLGPSGLYVDPTDVKGFRSVNGFDPLAPRRYIRAVGNMVYYGVVQKPDDFWRPGSSLLDVLRVSTVIVNPPSTTPDPGSGTKLG